MTCPFCEPLDTCPPLIEMRLWFIVDDGFPVSPGHKLIIPYRHVQDYFDLTREELVELHPAIRVAESAIWTERDNAGATQPTGFNIGINIGEAAGQTVPHLHVHLIPRYTGDVDDPRGGVRWVVPEKARYWD